MLTLKHLLRQFNLKSTIDHIKSEETLDINEFINFLNQISHFWEYIKIEYLSELRVLYKANSTLKKAVVNISDIV